MIVRGSGLEASMSRYLIDRIKMLENVDIVSRSEVAAVQGARLGRLEGVTIRDRASGATRDLPARQLFMFIGADPNTTWLDGCVALDEKGYVLTGASPQQARSVPYPLQTSLPRVFAVGDARAGSTKRVASAVGEGAAVVAQIHSFLGASTATA
jgi:thioredoxin reductase (NADPH)